MKQLAYRQQQGNKGYLPKIEKPPPQKPRGREEAYRITDNGIFRWPYGAQRRPAQDQQQYKDKGRQCRSQGQGVGIQADRVLCAFS